MKLSPGLSLEAALSRQQNNLDFFRLACALLVIFGHSYLIMPAASRAPVGWDVFTAFGYPGVYSASVAVKVFFFISGLLVTDSLVRKDSAAAFIASRFLRVWPALALLLVGTVWVLGPLLTGRDLREYLGAPETLRYLVHNLTLNLTDSLPGVFSDNPHPDQVNGSLWTLRYEIAAYGWLLVFHALGALRRPWLLGAGLVLAYLDPLLPHPLLPTSQTGNPQIMYLPSCFALGACLAVAKRHVILRWENVALVATAFALLRHTILGPHLLFLTVFLAVLQLAVSRSLQRWRPAADLSYGTYLWGFPAQQLFAQYFSAAGFAFNFVGASALALGLAWCSWHLVEQPAIAWGRRFARPSPPPASAR